MSKLLRRVARGLLRMDSPVPGLPGAGRWWRPLRAADDLVVDLGAHRGHDTDFYLEKGFRVVAVEADPTLVGELRRRFAPAIAAGRLHVVPYGIHEREGAFAFYQNLDK